MYELQERAIRDGEPMAATEEVRPGRPLDPARLFLAIRRGKWWILGVTLIACAGAYPAARFLAPPRYVSQVALVWERPPALAEQGEDARLLRTMVDSVELTTNLAKVRSRMGLTETVPEIGGSVNVTFEPESNVITVAAMRRDPDLAATLANTTVDVFLEDRRATELGRRGELLRALEMDVERARRELDAARATYDSFRTEHGIADLSLETQQAIELAADLREQADLARADAQAEEARSRTLRNEARRLGSTSVTKTVHLEEGAPAESGELAQARTQLAEAQSGLSDEHPTVQALVAKVAALQEHGAHAKTGPRVSENRVVTPNAQWQTLRGSIAGSAALREVALDRGRSYEELAAAAQERLRRLSAVEGEASALLAAQRVAESHLAEIEGMRVRAADAARSASTGLRVVAPATRPEGPESSKKVVIVTAAIPVGAALFTVLCLLLGALGRLRPHTAGEVAYWSRSAVVGSSVWPDDPQALVDLVEDLTVFSERTRGQTLVVGATAAETDLARGLVYSAAIQARPARGAVVELPRTSEAELGTSGSLALARRPSAWPKVWSRSAVLGLPRPADAELVPRMTPREHLAVPVPLEEPAPPPCQWEAWRGPETGPALRRAARAADRVLVILRAGSHSGHQISRVLSRLGRDEGVGFLLVGLRREHADLPDRAGPFEAFWENHG